MSEKIHLSCRHIGLLPLNQAVKVSDALDLMAKCINYLMEQEGEELIRNKMLDNLGLLIYGTTHPEILTKE